MVNRDAPPAMLPGNYVLRDSDIERIVRAARGDTPTHDEFEAMAEKASARAIRTFLLEVGIDPNDLPGLRKDFAEMRSFREMKASIKDNGLRAIVTMFVTGVGVWFWAKVKGSP